MIGSVSTPSFLRRIATISPIAWGFFALRVLGYLALVRFGGPGSPGTAGGLGTNALLASAGGLVSTPPVLPSVVRVLLWTLPVIGTLMFLTPHARTFRVLLLAHVSVTALVLMIGPLSQLTAVVHFAVIALAAAVHEAFPRSLVFTSLASIIIPALFAIRFPRMPSEALTLLLVCFTIGLPTGLLSHFREQIIPLQRQVRTLMDNVERLTRANSLTQDYAREIEDESRSAERKRLTRDIHDLVGYTFTNAIMMTEAAKVMVRREPERIADFMESLRVTMEDGLSEVKRSLRTLRQQDAPQQPIGTAVRKLLRVFGLSTGVETHVEYGNTDWRAFEPCADCVYHFVQEALINAFRHGHAHRVTVLLWRTEDRHQIRIDDNGDGAPGTIVAGIGMSGMRERAEAHGGTVQVNRVPVGFSISMYLPKDLS